MTGPVFNYNKAATQEALMELWEADRHARDTQGDFWRLADRLVQENLVAVDDVANIYGCAPWKARDFMRTWSTRGGRDPRG